MARATSSNRWITVLKYETRENGNRFWCMDKKLTATILRFALIVTDSDDALYV